MAGRTNKNKDKDPIIDEVLNEDPPEVDEASDPKEVTDIPQDEILADPENEEPVDETEPTPPLEEVVDEKVEDQAPPEPDAETVEQREQRYKAQQTEAQIQAERNKALTDKVEEAANIATPTDEELRAFVAQDGINWDELTNFEQATAKRTYLAEKRFQLVNESVQTAKQVDEWAKKIDTFIDETDGKPEFVELGGNEADFRKYAMKEAHRGTPPEILLGAFLHSLPRVAPKRGSLFESGSGGDKVERSEGISDADMVANLRKNDPREYKRQLKMGKIKLDV